MRELFRLRKYTGPRVSQKERNAIHSDYQSNKSKTVQD